jgi:fructokinase
MRRVYTIGETVLDIIFRGGQPVSATPGGAMLNTAVSLGRIGLPVSLITEFGVDLVGRMIESFLASNGVSADHVMKYKEGKTALALAFLDENNKADFDFYRPFPASRLQGRLPEFRRDDLFLFGSFFSLDLAVRDKLMEIVHMAQKAGAIILYDPNFRKAHLHELKELFPLIEENVTAADIVKGSDDDFRMILGTQDPHKIFRFIRARGCSNLILTQGPGDVIVKTEEFEKGYPVRPVEVRSTIGAGDNFNAGMLYSLYSQNVLRPALSRLEQGVWDTLIANATAFAGDVCGSYENFISPEFARRFI